MKVKALKLRFDRRFKRKMCRSFERTLTFLKKDFPLLYPVEIKPLEGPNPKGAKFIYGMCTLVTGPRKKPKFVIMIADGLAEDMGIYTLLHEWAHALSWVSTPKKGSDHGAEWGVAYSRIESAYSGEKYG